LAAANGELSNVKAEVLSLRKMMDAVDEGEQE